MSFTSFLLLLLLMGISCFSLGSLFVVVFYHLTTKCLGIVLCVLISKICKELTQINYKKKKTKQIIQFKNGHGLE